MKLIIISLIFSFCILAKDNFLGFRHLHNGNAHKALEYMKAKTRPVVNKGRVNVYKIIDKDFNLNSAPKYVKEQFFKVELSDLINVPSIKEGKFDIRIKNSLALLSMKSYRNYVSSLVAIGTRSRGAEAKSFLVSELQKIGLNPISTDYNIISKIEGKSNRAIVVIGHMDTVSRTVGADDNASGASGVLELAKAISIKFENTKPEKTIYFVLSEDEEDGLLGAKKFVKDLKAKDLLETIDLAINMDMIAYNSNGIVDLETNKDNEDLALEFAQIAKTYTTLKPNLVLNPWGSDHMPFLNNNVSAILTIESWQDHTPCWHKSCDTLETLNFEYAFEILKINLSAILTRTL